LRSVTEMIQRRLGYESIYLLLVDREREDFALAAHSGNLHGVVDDNYRQPLDVGICGDVYRTGRIRNIPNVHAEPLHFDPDPSVPVESEIVVPLIVNDEVIGVISAESSQRAAFTALDETVLTAVADQLAIAIHVAQLHDQAKRAAATDGLTGVANHRAFYEALEAAAATGQPFALVLFDVEGLKEINDTAGHLAGDALLRRVGQTIREMVRATDIVARYGGDEFAVILQEATAEQAAAIGDRVRQRLLECEMPVPGVRATVRFGVAAAPSDGTRPMSLVAVADSRMYDMHAQARRSRPRKMLVRRRLRPWRAGLHLRPRGLNGRAAQ
jgi:diguanylate cyclase (GGDEF)-like protein